MDAAGFPRLLGGAPADFHYGSPRQRARAGQLRTLCWPCQCYPIAANARVGGVALSTLGDIENAVLAFQSLIMGIGADSTAGYVPHRQFVALYRGKIQAIIARSASVMDRHDLYP